MPGSPRRRDSASSQSSRSSTRISPPRRRPSTLRRGSSLPRGRRSYSRGRSPVPRRLRPAPGRSPGRGRSFSKSRSPATGPGFRRPYRDSNRRVVPYERRDEPRYRAGPGPYRRERYPLPDGVPSPPPYGPNYRPFNSGRGFGPPRRGPWNDARRRPFVNHGPTPRNTEVDRTTVCPFLLRLYAKLDTHHSAETLNEHFAASEAGRPSMADSELQVYAYRDSSLREITDLVKDVCPEAKSRNVRLSLSLIRFDDKGELVVEALGSVHSSRPGPDDRKTLNTTKFDIGDYLSLAILRPPRRDRFGPRGSPGVPEPSRPDGADPAAQAEATGADPSGDVEMNTEAPDSRQETESESAAFDEKPEPLDTAAERHQLDEKVEPVSATADMQ